MFQNRTVNICQLWFLAVFPKYTSTYCQALCTIFSHCADAKVQVMFSVETNFTISLLSCSLIWRNLWQIQRAHQFVPAGSMLYYFSKIQDSYRISIVVNNSEHVWMSDHATVRNRFYCLFVFFADNGSSPCPKHWARDDKYTLLSTLHEVVVGAGGRTRTKCAKMKKDGHEMTHIACCKLWQRKR